MVAFLVPMCGGILNNMSTMGILPWNFITRSSLQIGFAWEAVLFSLGLADRINLLRHEKEAQEAAAREAQLRARAAELQAQAIEAEDRRKSEELEQARQLQLSMLPQDPPQSSYLDIAFAITTATEVGGDYYDFYEDSDGTLTVALGDATGHGLQAGIVVTAVKSLFMALARESEITRIFKTILARLKDMHLRRANMAMTMIKLKDRRLRMASAGTPPALLYRAATQRIE